MTRSRDRVPTGKRKVAIHSPVVKRPAASKNGGGVYKCGLCGLPKAGHICSKAKDSQAALQSSSIFGWLGAGGDGDEDGEIDDLLTGFTGEPSPTLARQLHLEIREV